MVSFRDAGMMGYIEPAIRRYAMLACMWPLSYDMTVSAQHPA